MPGSFPENRIRLEYGTGERASSTDENPSKALYGDGVREWKTCLGRDRWTLAH